MFQEHAISPAQLRMARVGIGLRLEEVAAAAHVSKNALSAIERGASSPNTRTLQRIVQVLAEHGAVFRSEANRVWVGVNEGEQLTDKTRAARKALDQGRSLPQTIGYVAREARRALDLSQEEAAERFKLNPEFYARVERGYSLPSTWAFAEMVAVLGVSADVLLGRRPLEAPDIKRSRSRQQVRGLGSRALRKAIGNAAREARETREITPEDAAERIGVSPEFYARIERGTVTPSLRTVARMAEVLEVSADTLLGTGLLEGGS